MDAEFISMSDILYDIKEKITDNEYMNVMNKLSKIREKYQEDIKEKNICNCISGESNFCTYSIEGFMTCKNIHHTLDKFPILRNQLILYSLPDYTAEIHKYNHHQFFKSDLQLEPMNPYKILNEDEKIEYIKSIKLLLNLTENIKGKVKKVFMTLSIYDLVFKNFGFLNKNIRFMKTIYTKLDEFLEEPNTKPVIELLKKLYNLDDNPYIIFKNNIEPYYLKALVNEQIRERQAKNYFTTPEMIEEMINNMREYDGDDIVVNIDNRFPPEIQQWLLHAMLQQEAQPQHPQQLVPNTRRQARELQQEQRQQAEEAVIQESRYPLRNRIQSRINQSDRQ